MVSKASPWTKAGKQASIFCSVALQAPADANSGPSARSASYTDLCVFGHSAGLEHQSSIRTLKVSST